MKKFIVLTILSVFLAANALAVSGSAGVPMPNDVGFMFNRGQGFQKGKLGSQVTEKKVNVMKAQYDFAKQGGASTGPIVLKDAAGGDAVLPKNAVIKSILIDTSVSVTSSASNIGKISLGINNFANTDLLAATAITSAFVAGTPKAGIPNGSTTWVKTNGQSAVVASVTIAPLTAGKFNVFIEYYLSD